MPGARNGAWLKIKHTRRQELVIGGWLPGAGRRTERIGALLMGYHEDGALRYAGRVGTGFTERVLQDLASRLAPLRRPENPFTAAPKLPRETQFVEPLLVAEVEFTEWTSDGVMRAPSYKGLRDDKSARDVVREDAAALASQGEAAASDPGNASAGTDCRRAPQDLFDDVSRRADGTLTVTVDRRALKLSNWDKVLFPETGFTKGDLIAYYALVAPVAVPHLTDER